MARKKYNEKRFEITRKVYIECWTENTSYGFRHMAELIKDYYVETTAKCTYYNRTWESYEYESVLKELLESTIKSVQLTDYAIRKFKQVVKSPDRVKDDLAPLKALSTIMGMADIMGGNQKTKNDWKERMLKAGLENKGLIMPENWGELTEADKEKRLNGAIAALS